MGPINGAGQDFISELGHRISDLTEDPRETSFLFQRISVALQRSFQPAFVEDVALPCLVPATVFWQRMQATRDVKLPTYNFFNIHARTELPGMTWTHAGGTPSWGAHAGGAHAGGAHAGAPTHLNYVSRG
jgi:hypothetical protein